jgi:hypothetical protein
MLSEVSGLGIEATFPEIPGRLARVAWESLPDRIAPAPKAIAKSVSQCRLADAIGLSCVPFAPTKGNFQVILRQSQRLISRGN